MELSEQEVLDYFMAKRSELADRYSELHRSHIGACGDDCVRADVAQENAYKLWVGAKYGVPCIVCKGEPHVRDDYVHTYRVEGMQEAYAYRCTSCCEQIGRVSRWLIQDSYGSLCASCAADHDKRTAPYHRWGLDYATITYPRYRGAWRS